MFSALSPAAKTILAISILTARAPTADAPVSFVGDVKPLLARRCFSATESRKDGVALGY
jgi:hypothetical protein